MADTPDALEVDSVDTEIRTLDITDEERIDRFREAGYGGNVSDALAELDIEDTVLSSEFTPLRQGMKLAGRVLPVKLHSQVMNEETESFLEERWEREGGHPQKRMMETISERPDGTVLCFDCGGDMQPAQFGEMSCQLAYSEGCRGMLVAGNMRDTQYVLQMDDFPAYSYGTTPNAFGGWVITQVNKPIHLEGHLTHYVEVHPGDFVFADNDGAQIIPEAVVDEVLLRVEEIYEKENEERERIAQGMSIDEVYDEYGVL